MVVISALSGEYWGRLSENDGMLNFNREVIASGIARRLIIYVVLFSSLITLLTTAIQLYRAYDDDIYLIEQQLQQVQDVQLKALTATLWASDTKELRTHLEGISHLRDMQFLEIRDKDKVWVSLGATQSSDIISRQYPMIYPHRGRDIEIGTLTVVASLTGVYQRLIEKIWVILVSNGIKTFLVAGFILVIFHALITRHLIHIADFTHALDINRLDQRLSLDRKGYRKQNVDELDTVVDAINSMREKLMRSISLLRHSESKIKKHHDHLEELVMERTAELKALNKELESFSYSVSHDLRAPLRAIDGFSLAVLEDFSDKMGDEGRDYLQRIRKGAQRMSGLIDSILQLSRVTRREIQIDNVDLSAIAAAALSKLEESESGRNVDLIVARGVHVHGDSHLLELALDNLLGNAWKYTSKTASARIEFGVMQQDGESVYFIKDNGVGFDMNYAGKLFGAFQRLHREDEFPGTGIGLATVQRIIHRHGGRIWAEAEQDQGATFFFTLGLALLPDQ